MVTEIKSDRSGAAGGKLVISLDFELYWGVHDVFSKHTYADHIRGARLAVPAILDIFKEYGIHATWAIVGMVNFKTMSEWQDAVPALIPAYKKPNLSSYVHADSERIQENDYDLYFAPELIAAIRNTPGQEIASHTFSHYYCLEKGQTLDTFIADAQTFSNVMRPVTRQIRSVVFPRNQVNESYLAACRMLGIHAYRGNEQGWIYRMEGSDRRNFFKRGLRFLDTYIDLFGPQTYPIPDGEAGIPVNIMGSRQLKPVSTSLNRLEKMRLRRILNAMTHAAMNGEIYHLWWHPHNFGVQLDENMDFLRKILEHFRLLQKSHHFESMAMEQLAADILEHAENGSKHEVSGSM